MIISKTPYRIPLTGGGTDINFYYKKKKGHICSVAINQYVYVLLRERDIDNNYLIQTTSTEFKNKIEDIKHKLIKETLKFFKIKEKVHVGTYSTVPTQTGLGTSSAMVVGLINCINKYKNLKLSNKKIYKYAYIIEREICNYHGGWQDQIVSQYGGFVEIKINKNEKIIVKKFKKNIKLNNIIKKNFILVYSNQKRDSSKVILSQKKKAKSIIQYYDKIKLLNKEFLKNLNHGNIDKIGEIFDFHWNLKKKLSNNITNKKLNIFYEYLMKNFKFTGGKLIGAGGGGFFLMSLKNQKEVINKLKSQKINYVTLDVENQGSHIIEN